MTGQLAWHGALVLLVVIHLAAAVVALGQWHRRVRTLNRRAGSLLRQATVALAEARALHTYAQVEMQHLRQHHAVHSAPDGGRYHG